MAVIYTPEVNFDPDMVTIFDPGTSADGWDDPSQEQIADEDREDFVNRKKLHIRQVRTTGHFNDCSFICSKKNIRRDFVVFFKDFTVYGDIWHSDKCDYIHVINNIGNTIVLKDVAVECIKAHNRSLLNLIKDVLGYMTDRENFGISTTDLDCRYLDIIYQFSKKIEEDDEYYTFIGRLIKVVDALIYTEDDKLII
jgi:hypothetical protein